MLLIICWPSGVSCFIGKVRVVKRGITKDKLGASGFTDCRLIWITTSVNEPVTQSTQILNQRNPGIFAAP